MNIETQLQSLKDALAIVKAAQRKYLADSSGFIPARLFHISWYLERQIDELVSDPPTYQTGSIYLAVRVYCAVS